MDVICRKYKVCAMLSTQRWTSVDELASLSRRKQDSSPGQARRVRVQRNRYYSGRPQLGYRSPVEFKKLVSTEPATVQHLCAWGGSDRLDVLGPGLKSLSHLRFIFRAIVDPRDASTVTVHVI